MWRICESRCCPYEINVSKRWNTLVSWTQVAFLLLSINPTFTTSGRLEDLTAANHEIKINNQDDSVLINFPRRKNLTKTSRQLYLPPEEQQFFLPEVIDNRVRNAPANFRPSLPNSRLPLFAPPDVELRTPLENFENGEKSVRFSNNENFDIAKNAAKIEQAPKEYTTNFVQVNSMSCQNSGEELFFRASLKPPRFSEFPIIEGVVGENCRINRINEEYRIDLTNELFWNCGIRDCSNDRDRYYCLNVRFPAIAGLRLKEDFKVMLRCKTQDKTVSHTRRINVKTLDTSGRNSPRIETGGHKNTFETEVGLYRKTFGSGHLFDAKIQLGGTVILGEEILLRALVREGDGWRYSRISDVTVHYVEKKRRSKIMNSLWILDENGCLNPDVREICSREQYRVSPLENYLMFEAFMFDNMKETDEMVMSVKITGCLDGADCALNCPAGHSRRVRSTENNTVDWSDDITFRVVLPQDKTYAEEKIFHSHLALPYVLAAFVLVVVVAIVVTVKNRCFSKRNE